jgi:hypothetical protein
VPRPQAPEVFRALLGRNPGLGALRAAVEARVAYSGKAVTLPGVLVLDGFGGFRLELLDPLDRPLAILFVEGGRLVQFRPSLNWAASLGVLPGACRGVGPGDWVAAVLASSIGPLAGERLADRGAWGGGRILERDRGGEVFESLRYREQGGELRPWLVSWFCDDDVVMQLRVREWAQGSTWRVPARFELEYPKAGLSVSLELREVEGNPPPSTQPLRPQLGDDVIWTSWKLPQ